MGPSQVFVGLLTIMVVRAIWPDTITVLGGSHVTLLATGIGADGRCDGLVDKIMPGHCEEEFAELVARTSGTAQLLDRARLSPFVPFDYLPLFEPSQLAQYAVDSIAMPVQFTRGCSYGRCTFCTYPVVEPVTSKLHAEQARFAISELVAQYGIRRFSIKDSLFTVPMLTALGERLLEEPRIDVTWSATTKANRALISAATMLRVAGLATLEIGVETIHRAGQLIFDKVADPVMLEEVILALAESGITVVVNLIFGYPGERFEQAAAQLEWLYSLRAKASAGRIDCSLNMLEIVRGSSLSLGTCNDLVLYGIAPWAYCYQWNAPGWRVTFKDLIESTERKWHANASDEK